MLQDTQLGHLTARPVSVDDGCYLGDGDGAVCHISPEGELHCVCELNSRVETIYVDERHIYALTRDLGQSGTIPDTVHAIDREMETVRWTFIPEGQLNRYVVSGAEKFFLSTSEQIVALDAATGNIVWKSGTPVSEEVEWTAFESTSAQSDDNPEEHSADSEPESGLSGIEWKPKEHYEKKERNRSIDRSRLRFSTQPLFKKDLYAATTEGVVKIEPDTGEILWRTHREGDGDSDIAFPRNMSASPPTSDGTLMYLGSGDVVYAIELDGGKIKWQFETPGRPGAITYCDTSESVTFVTQGLAVNVDTDQW